MIFVGADHRGMALKAAVNSWLNNRGFEFEDVGSYEYNPDDDYVDYAIDVGQRVAKSEIHRGVVICGSGVGMDIAANKVEKVRSVLGFLLEQVTSARKDDNVNVLSLPADYIDGRLAVLLVERFLTTAFDMTERYERRIEKMARYEQAT